MVGLKACTGSGVDSGWIRVECAFYWLSRQRLCCAVPEPVPLPVESIRVESRNVCQVVAVVSVVNVVHNLCTVWHICLIRLTLVSSRSSHFIHAIHS